MARDFPTEVANGHRKTMEMEAFQMLEAWKKLIDITLEGILGRTMTEDYTALALWSLIFKARWFVCNVMPAHSTATELTFTV